MNVDTLIAGYKTVLSSIFSPKNYYERVRTHLQEYRKYAKTPNLPFASQVRALSGAIWKLGIIGKGKRHFWKLCIWTTFCRPGLFTEAISLSIYGYHYRRVLTGY